jgi:hypothetical protein
MPDRWKRKGLGCAPPIREERQLTFGRGARRRLRLARVPQKLIAAAAIAALFLFGFASTRLPLDQDLGSKAAKVESLSKFPPFASPMHEPFYYREAYFSFYYQVEALVQRVFGGSALASMGYSAALCGVIYFMALAIYLKSLAGIGPWWALFLFLNTPALIVNFLYGNEASLSMALLAVAAALISLRRGLLYDIAAGLMLGLTVFCRPDVVLMAPFILILLATDGAVLRFAWRRISATGLTAALTAVSYWAVVVRSIPVEAAFPWIIDWRIFAVYFLFGFGPVVFVLAMFGLSRRNKTQWLLPLSSAIPLSYYFRDLGSPKYILGLALGTTLCAAWAIAASNRLFKILAVAVSVFFWFVSVTPFGAFGPSRGGHWVAPAGHGPVPFGSYLSFYQHVHEGFFGVRYGALQKTWEIVLHSLTLDPRPMRLIGSSDDHMLNLICEQHRIARASVPLSIDLPGDSIVEPLRFVMLFNGYSRLSYLTHPGAEALVRQWLAAGQVTPLPGDDSRQALPYIVEIGPTVQHGSKDLGRRILFADSYAHGGGLAPLEYFTPDYGAFCFVPQSVQPPAPLYRDNDFAATDNCSGAVLIWGNWWPSVYYQRHADRAREALAGGRE